MNLFDRIFNSDKSKLDKETEDRIICKYIQPGLSPLQIRDGIAKCKKESVQEGTNKLPSNYGDYIIEKSKINDEKYKEIVERAISGGANEDDVRNWWNLNDIERRMIKWEDEIFRISSYQLFKEEGFTHDEEIIKIRKTFPIYGNPYDESNSKGDDRPLPDELHDKINRMTKELPLGYFQEYAKDHNSMNAFIRSELKTADQNNK